VKKKLLKLIYFTIVNHEAFNSYQAQGVLHRISLKQESRTNVLCLQTQMFCGLWV